ncbi:unnamed protein product [Leuciscus chuanchicus]
MGKTSDAEGCSTPEKAKAKKDLFEYFSLEKSESQNTRMWPLIFNDNPEDVPYFNPAIIYVDLIKTEFGTRESPYVLLLSEGSTLSSDVLSLTTACKMDLFRFPFDTQICSITLQSTAYSTEEVQLDVATDKASINLESKEIFQAQGDMVESILVNFLKVKGAEKRSVETTSTVNGQDDSVIDQQNPPDSVKDQNEESYTLNRLKQILTECRVQGR